MYHTLEEFCLDWSFEAESTIGVLNELTDESLSVRVTPEGRDIRTLAWHLVTSISEMMTRVGLTLDGPGEDDPAPATARNIVDGYRAAATSLERRMRDSWSDSTLREEHDMYGEHWSVAKTLGVLVVHQIHHRAQLTVLMRQAGLRVPGVYGPSREEWAAIGRAPLP